MSTKLPTKSPPKRGEAPRPVAGEAERSQAEKFAAAAREHGTDQDEEAFKGVLKMLGKRK